MKVIIAGGREYNNKAQLERVLDTIFNLNKPKAIISGMARGADKLGAEYAKEKGITLIEMPADWNKYGKSAGYKRNEQMASIADAVIAFWDGESKGTGHMIKEMRRLGKLIHIVQYKK